MSQAPRGSALTTIDAARIYRTLEEARQADGQKIAAIIAKARTLQGLSPADVAALSVTQDPDQRAAIQAVALEVKHQVYGKRLVLFAPLYVSNHCANECLYCAFRRSSSATARRTLSQEEISREVAALISQGHKRVLLVAGEHPSGASIEYLCRSVETIYGVHAGGDAIRRVNVNVAPLSLRGFRQLKKRGIGTYQLFQETYHEPTYREMHPAGIKSNFSFRLSAMDSAMEAGIDDVGIGALFGLYDWRFELLGLLQHIRHLELRFGVGPHTISVPRLRPAVGSPVSRAPRYAMSDRDFFHAIAVLRLAVPYTGIILSTREPVEIRRVALALGVSQLSAGSRSDPGGYDDQSQNPSGEQFALSDPRTLDEVILDIAEMGYLPSFCTACYRLGRTGESFMDLARPGAIRHQCEPNAIATFQEYLLDHGTGPTRAAGERLIKRTLTDMTVTSRERSERLLRWLSRGQRDVFY